MNDPKRLLDDTGMLTIEECRALSAHARFAAPPDARSELWSSLTTAIASAAVAPALSSSGTIGSSVTLGTRATAGGAAASHGLGLGAVVKLTLVGIGIGSSVATVNHLWSTHELKSTKPVVATTDHPVTHSSATSSEGAAQTSLTVRPNEAAPVRPGDHLGVVAPLDPMTASEPNEAAATALTSSNARATEPPSAGHAPAAPELKAESISASAREESQLVGSARSMLRAGNPATTLQLIELATSRFPRGILIQEREALRIEALAALGRTAEARVRASAFASAYPNSPHLSRVRPQ